VNMITKFKRKEITEDGRMNKTASKLIFRYGEIFIGS